MAVFRRLLEREIQFSHHLQTVYEGLDKPDQPMALEVNTLTADGEIAVLVHASNIPHVHARSILIYSHVQEHPFVISILNSLNQLL